MKEHQRFFEANKKLWDAKTPIHFKSRLYGLDDFKEGALSLKHIEQEELGDVNEKSILHLMCHFGLDTMSFSRLGANATGVDISEEAINTAKSLARDLSLNTKFIRSNIYDLKEHINDPFDIVFTSYGVLNWLPDLDRWANIIYSLLLPNGIFYLVEFHPFLWMLDDECKEFVYSYFHHQEPYELQSQGTYADPKADIHLKEYVWNHSLSDVFNSLLKVNFKIEYVHEFPYSTWECFPNMENIGKDRWVFKNFKDNLPYLFSIKATKD